MVMPYHLHMPSYFLETFTEYPFTNNVFAGNGQSRWGYKTEDDFRTVVKKYRENHVPLDMVYMDIDYMQDYKDFTVNEERFPDFEGFVQDMKKEKIHLVPIIDAGLKVEEGYDI